MWWGSIILAGAWARQASFPSSARVGDRVEFAAVERGEHEEIPDDDWRRGATRDRGLPFDVLVGSQLDGRLLPFGDTGAARPAELRPCQRWFATGGGGRKKPKRQRRDQRPHDASFKRLWMKPDSHLGGSVSTACLRLETVPRPVTF